MLPFLTGIMGGAVRPPVTPGSVSYTTPGTYSFTVPNFNTLSPDVKGAGGGLGYSTYYGGTGGTSSFNGSVAGYGGSGTWSYPVLQGYDGETGAELWGAQFVSGSPGGASGGDTNTAGGGAPGSYSPDYGVSGGSGGRAQKTYAYGQLTPGSIITVVVGALGANHSVTGSGGSNGSVNISWN